MAFWNRKKTSNGSQSNGTQPNGAHQQHSHAGHDHHDHDHAHGHTHAHSHAHAPSSAATAPKPLTGLSQARFVIAVASGKGGVGKSTVSSNLAIALKYYGKNVGLMDADVYGPTQTAMMGNWEKPSTPDGQLVPVQKHGIGFMSMGLLMGNDSPVVWRAPMAVKVIQQFISNVQWGALDYLLIDLPPGTGDVQLTLAQQASLSGAIIVTTPQQVALGIAKKGLQMFQQVNVPILGIIENMSGFTCTHCGKETAIFKEGGGEKLAREIGVPFLGSLPLDPEIMMSGDEGVPVLAKSSDSIAAKAFLSVAQELTNQLEKNPQSVSASEPKRVAIDDNGDLQIEWPDGFVGSYRPFPLRTNCGCANCVDENTGHRKLDPKQVPLDIRLTRFDPVGRYAVLLTFSDGHNTGIYPFKTLRDLGKKLNQARDSQPSFEV